jgi:hypothetical protein
MDRSYRADSSNFPPVQSLILETLGARFRLGETLWTFDTKTRAAARALEIAGMITTMHGIMENTYRASLTERGKASVLDPHYRPPRSGRSETLTTVNFDDIKGGEQVRVEWQNGSAVEGTCTVQNDTVRVMVADVTVTVRRGSGTLYLLPD